MLQRDHTGVSLRLHDIEAAMLVADGSGLVLDATPAARELFGRLRLMAALPSPLPVELFDRLADSPLGEAIVWRPSRVDGVLLGCTRYRLGPDWMLLLVREITEKQRALSARLHRQRLEATGRLVAHIAHDLRAPLSSIVYNADLLGKRVATLVGSTADLLREIQVAADQLRRTIAGLLDFVRLGPPVADTMTLRDIVDRASSLLRPAFRAGRHELAVRLHDDQVRVRGNPLVIDQMFVNLLINATEASSSPVQIRVESEPVAAVGSAPRRWRAVDDVILVRVADDGPGIPSELRRTVFEPFVTTKGGGTGLGLTMAREAAVELGGCLELEETPSGASFALFLPVVRARSSEEGTR
jgi:signal transduction histidine kinase